MVVPLPNPVLMGDSFTAIPILVQKTGLLCSDFPKGSILAHELIVLASLPA